MIIANSDCYFFIGKSHDICQDYAYAGLNANNNHVAIVADGCSSSPDTDFGSRLLTRASILCGEKSDHFNFDDLLAKTIIKATSENTWLDSYCYDSTLLYCELIDNVVHVVIAGDGLLFVRERETQNFHTYKFTYSSGAPYYLNYLMDKERNKQYLERFSSIVEIEYNGENIENKDIRPYYCFDANKFDLIGVSTDGIFSFDRPYQDILSEITAFKNYTGYFVKRRIKKFFNNCHETKQLPFDDFSVSMIYLKEENENIG